MVASSVTVLDGGMESCHAVRERVSQPCTETQEAGVCGGGGGGCFWQVKACCCLLASTRPQQVRRPFVWPLSPSCRCVSQSAAAVGRPEKAFNREGGDRRQNIYIYLYCHSACTSFMWVFFFFTSDLRLKIVLDLGCLMRWLSPCLSIYYYYY